MPGWGGDEFIVYFDEKDADAALRYCEAFQRKLSLLNTQSIGPGVTLGASIGVCDSQEVGHQLDKLVSGADLAMYQAKKSGRCRAVKYQLHQHTPVSII